MATRQYVSANFVESAGAILFDRSHKQTCLVHLKEKNEWLLAKGRRNASESLQTAALREVEEETGYKSTLLPVNLTSRTPPADNLEPCCPDELLLHTAVCEPFMFTLRDVPKNQSLKVIWWHIACVAEDAGRSGSEEQFEAEFLGLEDALKRLTFAADRDIVKEAVQIVEDTYGGFANMD